VKISIGNNSISVIWAGKVCLPGRKSGLPQAVSLTASHFLICQYFSLLYTYFLPLG